MEENSHTETEIKKLEDPILIDAQRFALSLFNQKHDSKLVYHNYQFTTKVVEKAESIARGNAFTEAVVTEAKLTAWFYHLGFLFDYSRPFSKSSELLQKFLVAKGFPASNTKKTVQVIQQISNNQAPSTKVGQCLFDAIQACHFCENFFEKSPVLKLEKEIALNKVIDKNDWAKTQLTQLLSARFFTSFSKINFDQIVVQNILAQKQITEKIESTSVIAENGIQRKFQRLERKLPYSGTQTFFRTNYRNHINLSAIADGKANIMITVNALLISVIVSIITYKNITETTPSVLFPAVIFLITGLSSLIFAVLSARPKVTTINENDPPFDEAQNNIVFFGNFIKMDLEKYEEAMDAMFRDSELLYGNMARDLYYLGKVLDKKYRYLSISYNIFMIGFIATVITFLILLFL
jgi:hypothetical protein